MRFKPNNQRQFYLNFLLLTYLVIFSAIATGQDGNQLRVLDLKDDQFSDFPSYSSPEDIAFKIFSITDIAEDIYILHDGDYRRLRLQHLSLSMTHYFSGNSAIVFFLKGTDAEGEIIYTPVGECEIPNNSKDMLVSLKKQGGEYHFYSVDMSLKAQPIGAARFLNLTNANLMVLLDEKRDLVSPSGEIDVDFNTNETKFFNFKIAVEYKGKAKLIYTKQFPFRGSLRRIFIGYVLHEDATNAGPFRVFSFRDSGPEPRPTLAE